MSSRPISFGVLLFLLWLCTSSVAGAAQIEVPTTNPFVVVLDAEKHPEPFTIAASGFVPGHQVFVEQCDGVNPSTPNWDPSIDCDSGSSPAPVVAGADGKAVFDATNANHRFLPFVGLSPQSQFSCLTQGSAATNVGGVPGYATCYVRVSSNNAAATSDQTLFAMTLPAGAVPPPPTSPTTAGHPGATTSSTAVGATTSTTRPGARGATTSTSSTTPHPRASSTTLVAPGAAAATGGISGSSSGGGSPTGTIAGIIVAIVIAAGVGGYVWALRRRRSATAAR